MEGNLTSQEGNRIEGILIQMKPICNAGILYYSFRRVKTELYNTFNLSPYFITKTHYYEVMF